MKSLQASVKRVSDLCPTQVLYIMYANIIILYNMFLGNQKHSNRSFEPDLFNESFELVYKRPNDSFERPESGRVVLESTDSLNQDLSLSNMSGS